MIASHIKEEILTMGSEKDNPYDALERIFHEPNRLAIMSALCACTRGLAFTELRESCNLTDGNLNRHLKVLEEARAIVVRKAFVGGKPRTTVALSKLGLERFNEYLEALAQVLQQARTALPADAKRGPNERLGEPVTP